MDQPRHTPPDRSPDAIDYRLLDRHFAGESSVEDRAALAAWVAADPARAQLIAALRDAWLATGRPAGSWDVERAWDRLSDAAARAAAEEDPTSRRRRARGDHSSNVPRAQRVALWSLAVCAVIATITIGARELGHRHEGVRNPFTTREYATRRGEHARITLTDGTLVELSADSHLSAPATSGARDVYLDGEAIFTVVHDAARPFRVHAGRAVTEDVGTRFDVRAYAGDPAVRVIVVEGRVAIGQTALGRGDLASVDSAGAVRVTSGVDPVHYLSWADGRLAFDQVPLGQVAADLSRWFKVSVRVADPALAERKITATFATTSIADALSAITIPLGLSYEWQSGGVVLLRQAR